MSLKELETWSIYRFYRLGPTEEAGRLFAEEGVHLDEATIVRLEFQNILRIDHLWMLTSLTKLDIAHNLIEKIENLEQLPNLNELDLSFNKIEKIENLECLINLEILTLFHNKIKKLENMETLEKLLIFSIGDNFIEDFKEVTLKLTYHSISLNILESDSQFFISLLISNLFFVLLS